MSVPPPKPKASLISRRVYTNNVPISELACPPKFLKVQVNDLDKHARCRITKLEEEYTYEVVPEDILKLCPPLVDIAIFQKDPNAVLDPLDMILLEDDFNTQGGSKRSQQHNRVVPWMRKTEYISTEFNRFGAGQGGETKIGYNIRKKMGDTDNIYKDVSAQIKAIEKIFDKTSRPVTKHYCKPGVKPVEELYILPDEEQWQFSYAQVIFDGDPLPNVANSEAIEERAILKGIMDNDAHFVAYFPPNEEAMELLRSGEIDEETELKCNLAREYNWTITNKKSKGQPLDMFVFTERDGTVFYNEIETKVKLARRNKKESSRKDDSCLYYKHRETTAAEEKAMKRRGYALYDEYMTGERVPIEESESEEEEEEPAADSDEEGQPQREAGKHRSDNEDESEEEEEEPAADSDEDEEGQQEQREAGKHGSDNEDDSDKEARPSKPAEKSVFDQDSDEEEVEAVDKAKPVPTNRSASSSESASSDNKSSSSSSSSEDEDD